MTMKKTKSTKTVKDSCYRKVKAKMLKSGNWPSAYASGNIVKCRQGKEGYKTSKTEQGRDLRTSLRKLKKRQK